jgi:hypothetical protein
MNIAIVSTMAAIAWNDGMVSISRTAESQSSAENTSKFGGFVAITPKPSSIRFRNSGENCRKRKMVVPLARLELALR